MSLRTRRLRAADVSVTAFAWSHVAGDVAGGAPRAADVWTPVDGPAPAAQVPAPTPPAAAEAAPAAPAPPAMPTPDQQAHLAALERDAFTKGYAQGERAGLEAGGKRAEAMLRRLAQTLDEVTGLRDTMVRQTERELVQLAVAIARRILQRELAVDPELTAALAHIALERLGGAGPATVRLHPDDHAIVTAGQSLAGRQVDVIADPAVSRGGCIVESEFGFIDASVDAQVDEIARNVMGDPVQAVGRRGVA